MTKKNHRSSAKGPTPQLRSRTTRSSKPRLLTDPTSSTQLLTTQLQSLGLYAAHIIGDGNCLFRALSDQVHGSPEKHRDVRRQVCDWIEQHKERYEEFVEDDDYLVEDVGGKAGKRRASGDRDKGKGLEAHLRCMRENATYGGHMELSAFAHLTKRNIKVIQPGLVYVIEWHAGESSKHDVGDQDEEHETVYVAYHDWEHFSSIRNLRGPHAGLPHVKETPAQNILAQRELERELLKEREREKERERKGKEKEREQKTNVMKVKLKVSSPSTSSPQPISASTSLSSLSSLSSLTSIETAATADPTLIPLPNSRSVSPFPPIPSTPTTIPTISPPIPATPASTPASINNICSSSHPNSNSHLLIHRSPKRTFDESSASGEDGDGGSVEGSSDGGSGREKRSRLGSVGGRSRLGTGLKDPDAGIMNVDVDRDTPGLSSPGSSSEMSSDSFSDLTSPSPPPHPTPTETAMGSPPQAKSKTGSYDDSRPLTRRQRKALGLPKSLSGKIIIPGGKWKGRQSQDATVGVVVDGDGGGEEWRSNGTGRVDVRGFRELKI